MRASTADMIFTVEFLVSYLSEFMTLEPGDIIATGTPGKLPEAGAQNRFLAPGDVVTVTFDRIGALSTTFVAEPPSHRNPNERNCHEEPPVPVRRRGCELDPEQPVLGDRLPDRAAQQGSDSQGQLGRP